MITAEEARKLAAESDEFLNSILAKVDALVRTAAENNKRIVPLYIDGLWSANERRPAITPLQQRIMDVLSNAPFNFSATFCPDGESYVPRGSKSNVEFTNFVIMLRF